MGMVPRGREPAPGACGANFLLPFDPSLDEVSAAAGKSRVVEFFYGDPRADLVRVVHDAGGLAGWQVGSAAEAVQAAVRVPVVAAGGVATRERFGEVMQLGADAVRVGTRFVVCPESGAHPEYVRRLLEAGDDDTVLTEWFGEDWESAPHRVLKSALDAAQGSGWRRPSPPDAEVDRDPSDMAMYAGTGVGHITTEEPAAAVVADLVSLL